MVFFLQNCHSCLDSKPILDLTKMKSRLRQNTLQSINSPESQVILTKKYFYISLGKAALINHLFHSVYVLN